MRNAVGAIRKRNPRTLYRTTKRKNAKAISHKRDSALRQVDVDDRKAPAELIPIRLPCCRRRSFCSKQGDVGCRQCLHLTGHAVSPITAVTVSSTDMDRAATRLQLDPECGSVDDRAVRRLIVRRGEVLTRLLDARS